MTTLQILLLGPPEVRWGKQVISIQRRIPQALLFYLASRGSMISHEELISVFWRDVPTTDAWARCHDNLDRLRSDLPDPSIIITDDALVGLDFDRAFVDQREFEALIDRAGRKPWQIPETEPLPELIHQLLQQSINLWRGARFLAGNKLPGIPPLDEWLTRTAAHLEHLRGSVIERLADHAYTIGDLETAIKLAYDALESDELNENIHYRVMQYLIEMGCLNEARQHLDHVRGLMRRELDISLPPKLISFYKRVHKLHNGYAPETPPKWAIHPSMDVPFVGRRDILLQIHRIFDQHKGAFILGEAGQGKTRLIQQFAVEIHPAPRLLVATCRPLEKNLPFQPINDVLRRHVTPDEWLALPSVWATRLARLLPELETMRPELEPPSIPEDPAQAQALLLDAIRQVFILLAEKQKLVFVLDDAHWADEATLSTVAYLLSRPPFDHNASLSVLARQEEITPHLENTLTSIQQSRHGEVIHLTRLSREDISDLTRFILQNTPSPEFVKILENETGGNSLFVLETLRSIRESEPQIDLSGNTPIPLAGSLLNSIRGRIHRLNAFTRNVLETAAIIGTTIEPKVLSAVTQQSDAKVVQALDDLERNLIIHTLPHSSTRLHYRFVHDKFQEALLLDISPVRAQMLHGRVACILADKPQPEQAAILAHHYEAAGELITAFEYWVDAGQRARQLFAIADATRSFSQAENLIKRIEQELSNDDIYRLYADWCEMAFETSDTELIRKLGNDVLKLGEQRHAPLLIGTALDTLSDACMTANQFEEGLDFATQAIPYLEQSDNTFELMEAYIHRGVFFYMLNRLDEATEAFQDALALSTDSNSPKVIGARANAHYQTSLMRTLAGWPESGREHALMSLDDANLSNRTYLRVAAYFVLALSSFYLGEYVQAREYSQLGIELAQRTQGWRMLGYLHSYAAAAVLMMGYLDSALEHASEAISLGEKYELNDVIALGCCQLGDLYTRLQNHAQAAQHYQRGFDAIGENFMGMENLFRLGFALFQTGQKETGHQTMALALTALQDSGVGLGVIMIQICQARAYAQSGEWDQARQLATHLKDETNWRSMTAFHLTVTILLGRIALHDEQIDSAIDHFKSTIQGAKLLDNVWMELEAQRELDKALRRAGIEDEMPRQRIDELIAQLRANITDEAIRGAWRVASSE
ncbi:MAG: AAA family ATPase [Chloroflexi bacterium]|nr:AAA family ATPase [Chloroflexota bacterium]